MSLMHVACRIGALSELYIGLGVAILTLLSSCSDVPGDAALRQGETEQAAKLYRSGAEQGDALAAMHLGMLLDKGTISPAEFGEAGVWFTKACDLGDRVGCHNVGVAYEYGKNGFAVDYVRARESYLKAAIAGYPPSQYNLASLYSNQHLSPPDDVEGLKWMLIAQRSAQGCAQNEVCQWVLRDPPEHKHRLEARMTDAERQEAAKRAQQWQASH